MSDPVASLALPNRRSIESAMRQWGGVLWRSRVALAAFFLASLMPLGVRLLIFLEGGYGFGSYDMWGVYSDVGAGFAATALLAFAWRLSRILFVPMMVLWLAANAGFYEFFREYESPYFLVHAAYILDPTFVEGSGIRFTHPVLFAAAAILVVAFTIVAGHVKPALPSVVFVGLALVGMLLAWTQPWSQFTSPWRQRNFVSLNVADVATRAIWPDTIEADLDANRQLIADYLKPDLSGTPILTAAKPRRNVVMIFIEGVSGGQIPSIAAAQGADSDLSMPLLDGWARDNLTFSNFVTHQRQSDRGIYAALCGDLPRLMAGLPKMTEVADAQSYDRKCLPQVLVDQGYNSLFLHAAYGSFMQMGAFMHKIGFQRDIASEDFDPSIPQGPWGVDDGTLYARALKEIDGLAQKDKPFLVTMFTTSTHHPYGIPDSFTDEPDQERRHRAWDFADHAVTEFLADLKAHGHLDDTLVLVTSDEATQIRFLTPGLPGMLVGLTENWGYMIALTPERLKARIDQAFQQADIPLSVLDYLGIADKGRQFMGRSFFRRYGNGRSFVTGNVYKRRVVEYDEGRNVTVCDASLTDCHGFDVSHGPLFSPKASPAESPAEPTRLMRAIRAYSVTSATRPPALGG